MAQNDIGTPPVWSTHGGSSENENFVENGKEEIPEGPPPAIAQVTKDFYEKLVRQMAKMSSSKRSIDPLEPKIVSPSEMVEDLFARKDLRESSFETYRSALTWHLRCHITAEPYRDALIRMLKLQRERAESLSEPRKRRRRKAKVIPESDFKVLVEELAAQSSRSKWSYRAQYFLMAALATGVRPIEWLHAVWDDEEKTAIRVVTAKQKISAPGFMRDKPRAGIQDEATDEHDELSGAPEERTIPIEDRDRFSVETHMNMLQQELANGVEYRQYYAGVRQAVLRACTRLWGGRKKYSPYVMRSQFSANSRAVVGADATATLMGHKRPDTPSMGRYGKSQQAHSQFRNRSSDETAGTIATPFTPTWGNAPSAADSGAAAAQPAEVPPQT